MAYGDTFRPAGTSEDIKVRGPLWVGLWSITGVYAVWWIWRTAKDLSEYGKAKGYDLGQNPTMTLLAIIPGFLLIIPPIVAVYRQAKRIQQAQGLAGSPDQMNGWLALVLYLVLAPVFYGYEQSELNKAWAAEGGPVPERDDTPARLETGPSGEATAASTTPTAEPAIGSSTTTPAPEAPSTSDPERQPGA